jgi:hypothetical protein
VSSAKQSFSTGPLPGGGSEFGHHHHVNGLCRASNRHAYSGLTRFPCRDARGHCRIRPAIEVLRPIGHWPPREVSPFDSRHHELTTSQWLSRAATDCLSLKFSGSAPYKRSHFTVDGTLIEAWASLKSFRLKSEQRSDRTPPDDCAYPRPKPGRIDDVSHRGSVSLRCGRTSGPAENPGHLYAMRDESEPRCNTKHKPSGHRASAPPRTR